MSLQGKGRIQEPVKGRIMIYVPTSVHRDSAFPFSPHEEVIVEIKEKTLVIRKS